MGLAGPAHGGSNMFGILRYQWIWLVVAALSGACPSGKRRMGDRFGPAQANDRIMLVRKEPRTLGFQRLESQSGVYPDLGVFLHVHGMPDFLAESTTANRHFLILYYLENRCAFACRAKEASTRVIEFSGPNRSPSGSICCLRG